MAKLIQYWVFTTVYQLQKSAWINTCYLCNSQNQYMILRSRVNTCLTQVNTSSTLVKNTFPNNILCAPYEMFWEYNEYDLLRSILIKFFGFNIKSVWSETQNIIDWMSIQYWNLVYQDSQSPAPLNPWK